MALWIFAPNFLERLKPLDGLEISCDVFSYYSTDYAEATYYHIVLMFS